MWIDSHCHLHYESDLQKPTQPTDALLKEARAAGVEAFVTVGVDRSTFAPLQKYAELYEDVVFTVGFHPHEASQLNNQDLSEMKRLSAHSKCRAIGEIGIDYYYNHSSRETQIAALNQQLDLASEVKLPVVIHSRDGEADLLEALRPYAKNTKAEIPGVIHCFTGTYEFGKACLDLGFFISFSGIITFKNAEDLRQCARKFPLERLLVETDSPYLAPIPFRGKICEPKMVIYTGQKLAETKGISAEQVGLVTTSNAKAIFKL